VDSWGSHTATHQESVAEVNNKKVATESLSSSAPTKFPTNTPPTPHAATQTPTLYPTFNPTSYPTPVPTYNMMSAGEAKVNAFINKREADLALVKANVTSFDGQENTEITTALQNEFNAWDAHKITLAKHDGDHHAMRTWQGNMVKYTLMEAGIDHFFHGGKDNGPLFLKPADGGVFDLYSRKKQDYMKVWFKHMQTSSVGPPTASNTYHCMAYDAQSRDDNGGYADPTVMPATCATVESAIQDLIQTITKSVDAEVWNGKQ